jgi:hypothetical protein
VNPASRFFLGVDLGQRQDHSALVLVERELVARGWDYVWQRQKVEVRYVVRDAKRLPLGMTYLQVVDRVRQALDRFEGVEQTEVVVDATGLGAPVVEILQTAGLRAPLTAVTITAGESAKGYHAPKRDLIALIETMLEARRLKIAARHPGGIELMRELENMDAAGSGKRDDMVLALALALWWAKKRFPGRDE